MQIAKRAMITISISAAFLFINSCKMAPHNPAELYILICDNTKIPYFQSALAGFNRAAAEMKVKSAFDGPDTHDVKGEHDAFRRAVAQKPAGILVSAADASLLTPDINSAVSQGIPVVTFDSDASQSKRLFFVGSDNFNAGTIGGNLTAKLLNRKGSVVFFTIPTQGNLKDRLEGYQAAFTEYPDIKIAEVVDTNGNSDVAFDNAKRLLNGKTKIDAMVCLEALACPAVADVVNRANMGGKVTIVAMDTDPGTLDWIQKGVISATIAQKPFTMGYFGAKMLGDIHLHPPNPLSGNWSQNSFSPIPRFVDTGTFVIDKGNVASLANQQPPEAR